MSAERFTLDTNILVYSVDARDTSKRDLAATILRAAGDLDCPLPLQTIGEFYFAITRKLMLSARDAAARANYLMASFDTFAYSASAMRAAIDIASHGRLSLWDGLLLASAAEAGCTLILSEDMQDGARFGSIQICNPFGRGKLSERARALLEL